MEACKGCYRFGDLMYTTSDLLRPYGVHVLHPDYKVQSFSLVLTCTQVFCYILLTITTLCTASDFIEIAFCLTTFGQYLQGVFKIFLHIAFRAWMIDMPKQFHDLYTRYMTEVDYKAILDHHVEYCWAAFRVIKISYFSTGLFMVIRPALQRIYDSDSRILPLQVFLPYLDPTTFPGYELHYVYHSAFLILAISGFSFSDTYFVSLMVVARAHVKVIIRMLKDLDRVLLEFPEDRVDQEKRLKRICLEQQLHVHYMTKLDYILAVHSTVLVGTSATVFVICMVVLVKQRWLFGFFLCGISFCSMLHTFLIGQVYEVVSQEFTTQLYFIEWNALLPKHRKMLRLVLQMSQCSRLMTLAGIAPNNLNMFLQVLKQIYALLMFLLKFA